MNRLVAALMIAAGSMAAAGPASAAPFCKTLKGESVSFGEPAARKDAVKALEKEIKIWEERYNTEVTTKDMKMTCDVYIQFLNEFACTAEAVACRNTTASTPGKR